MISCLRFEIVHFSCSWLILLVLGAATACGTPTTTRLLVFSVTNEFGRTVTEIRKQPCGDLEFAFVPIEDSRLGVEETGGVAFDSRGRIVGEQRGLRMLSGARWVLRR